VLQSFVFMNTIEVTIRNTNTRGEVNSLRINGNVPAIVYGGTEKNQKIFIEVKKVTLFREKKIAEFPDAITSRGSKHLKTLIEAIKKGYKSYIMFLVQIQRMEYFKIAKDIDKEYYQNYLIAKKAGVNFLAYRCKISPKEIKIEKKLKIIDE